MASFKLVLQADNFLNFLLGFDEVPTYYFIQLSTYISQKWSVLPSTNGGTMPKVFFLFV